jgi:hypothetical protein
MEHKQPLVVKEVAAAAAAGHDSKRGQKQKWQYRKMWWFLAAVLICTLFSTQLFLAGSFTDTARRETTADAPLSLLLRGQKSAIATTASTAAPTVETSTSKRNTTTIAETGRVQIRHRLNETAADIADQSSSLLFRGDGSTIATTASTSATVGTSASASSSTSASKNNTQALDQNATSPTTSPYPHPHAGARDANGNWGYVADVTRVRRWMLQRYHDQFLGTMESSLVPPLSYLPMTVNDTATVCNMPPRKGVEGKHGWDVVLKVEVDLPLTLIHNSTAHDTSSAAKSSNSSHSTFQNTNPSPHADGVSKGKILCGIYTYEKMHYRVIGVAESWGWRCDGFLAASTATIDDPTQPGFPATDLPHEGKEEYNNMWQKTRSILSYMHDHYLDDYDYFYLSGDDTHLIVENLRRFLYETEQTHDMATEPVFMGSKFKAKGKVFNAGGAGYVLNRVALQRLVRAAFPTCLVHARQSSEDRFVAKCLQAVKIHPLDTVDALGRQRFHGMDSDFIGRFEGQDGYFREIYQDWGTRYGYKTGVNLVSEQSISFHIIRTSNQMRRHHAILYESCPADTVLAKAVREARTERARLSLSAVVSTNSSAIAS